MSNATSLAGRPVKKRTAKSFKRDMEALMRLRQALMTDSSLNQEDVDDAVNDIESLSRKLAKFVRTSEQRNGGTDVK